MDAVLFRLEAATGSSLGIFVSPCVRICHLLVIFLWK
jgi:hypothetical protein